MQRLPARIVPVQDTVPDILRRLGKPEQIPIFSINDTFIDQEIYVDRATPIGLTHQHDRDWFDLTSELLTLWNPGFDQSLLGNTCTLAESEVGDLLYSYSNGLNDSNNELVSTTYIPGLHWVTRLYSFARRARAGAAGAR